MRKHTLSLLADVLNKLTIIGVCKKLKEEEVAVWSEALGDLTDSHLLAGLDWLKKHGIDKTFNAPNFRKCCKEAYTPKDEQRILDPTKQLVSSISPNIIATEWLKRVANRESTYINSLPVHERAQKYKNAEHAIIKHSGLLKSLVKDKEQLESFSERVEEAFECDQVGENNKDALSEKYINTLDKLESINSVVGDLRPVDEYKFQREGASV